MIIGTAGHIDHGKTALVQALTGVDADRLREEKRRGITIDLGFAYWPQPDGSSIGFVDVPGHEGYIHNMLAGITGVSLLLLVVAVDDGIKPQTREHLQIASYLGLKNVAVALTKCDLATEDLIKGRQTEVRALLAEYAMGECAIIPVSARNGFGMDDLRVELLRLDGLWQSSSVGKAKPSAIPFIMAIDRVFSLEGVGTVVTGGVLSGVTVLDDRLILSPQGRELRVRGIHAQNRMAKEVGQGARAALNLAGISKDEISRGDRLISAELHQPSVRFDAQITTAKDLLRPMPGWSPVHLHCGTGHWPARIVPLEQDKLQPGTTQLVQIVLEKPVALFNGDRLILRDASATQTIGGGIVLDRHAPERNRRKPERLVGLRTLAAQGATEALPKLLALPPHAMDIKAYAADHALPVSAFDEVTGRDNLLRLHAADAVFLMAPATLLMLSREIREKLQRHHEIAPDQAGLASERLRLALVLRLAAPVFAAIVEHMIARKEIVRATSWLRLPDHVPRLSAEHEAIWGRIKSEFIGDMRFRPPRVAEFSEQLRMRQDSIRGLLKRLARRGDLQEIAEDQFLAVSAIVELAVLAAATGKDSPDGWFNAATYRDRIGIGRKMAILILEFFDRQGLTIRKGDLRKIDPQRLKMFLAKER